MEEPPTTHEREDGGTTHNTKIRPKPLITSPPKFTPSPPTRPPVRRGSVDESSRIHSRRSRSGAKTDRPERASTAHPGLSKRVNIERATTARVQIPEKSRLEARRRSVQIPEKSRLEARRRSLDNALEYGMARRTTPQAQPPALAPPPQTANRIPRVRIPRKQFMAVKELFDDFDQDADGSISLDEFYAGFHKMKNPLKEGPASPLTTKTFNSVSKNGDGLSLLQFMCLHFPTLPKSDVERAISRYTPPASIAPPERTLGDIPGAREEIQAIFTSWDKRGEGFVYFSDIETELSSCGITTEMAASWLQESRRAQCHEDAQCHKDAQCHEDAPVLRRDSRISLEDVEGMLGEIYLEAARTPKPVSLEQQKKNLRLMADLL